VQAMHAQTRKCPRVILGFFLMAGILGFVSLLGGCSVGYLFHVGKGQLKIVCGSQRTEAILRDPQVPESEKEKIRLVMEAKAFGEAELGLASSNNYTRYYLVEHPPIAYNLTASPRLSLEAYRWCFPIAGCLPYKGFFAREKAERESVRMSERGYDTYTRPVAAYSTLGWFKDPIFSTMLRYGDTALVEVILHEMVHRTIFVKDRGAFNEAVATFVGEKGMETFFRSRGGLNPGQIEDMQQTREAKLLFQKTMFDLADRLRLLYSAEGEEQDKLEARDRIFEGAKASLRKGLEALGSTRYGGILREDWNNALLVSYLTYHQDPDLWEALYDRFDRDLRAMVDWLKGLKGEKDPMARIERWLTQGEETMNH
jgi:predicted aminopeptidase